MRSTARPGSPSLSPVPPTLRRPRTSSSVRSTGCLNRVVNDYGPKAGYKPTRIIDMYEPDFFAICGCPSYSGTTLVTVSVY